MVDPDILIRKLVPADEQQMFAWACDKEYRHALNLEHDFQTYAGFHQKLHQLMLSRVDLCLLETRIPLVPIGYFSFALRRPADGWGWIEFYLEPRHRDPLTTRAALAKSVATLFREHRVRKITMGVFGFAPSLADAAAEVGFIHERTTKEEYWFQNRHWDRLHLSIYRESMMVADD